MPRDPPASAPHGTDPPTGTDQAPSGACLRCEVVAYPEGPDRCTVFPPGLDGVPRMSTWLTADRDAFVALDAVR
ncbi:MAG: hypothetical protein ABEI39_00150 [Halobacteriales archaeon]